MPFTLPTLNYNHNALHPIIDEATVRIHHSLHHQTYVNKLNEQYNPNNYNNSDLVNLLQNTTEMNKPAVRNNAGGHYNHSLYWYILNPLPTEYNLPSVNNQNANIQALVIVEKLIQQYTSLNQFKAQFVEAGMSRFGSGWVWLCVDQQDEFSITTTPNQDNPLMRFQGEVPNDNLRPVIGIDLWEHAYYLNYQNRRQLYLDAIWALLDWNKVNDVYVNSTQLPPELKYPNLSIPTPQP